MNYLARNALIYSILAAGAALAATPVEKSGPCPTLDRVNHDAADNWEGFPTRPTDDFDMGCSDPNKKTNCRLQKSLTPAQSINCIVPAEGLKVQLWASEEMAGNMKYIQHFSFDERGRVWAVEPMSYPNNLTAASGSITDAKFVGGKDRIVILEDTDGDHVMDKFTVFRDGLNMPQSIECVNGGVVVSMTPYVVYFPNHNDTAGTPVILYQGMGTSAAGWDTHGGINQLMYGLDNWIYGSTGYNNCNATGAGITGSVDCGHAKVWRFRNTTIPGMTENKFEVVGTGFTQNSDGLGETEDGQFFQSGATSSPHMNFLALKGQDPVTILTKPANAGSVSYDPNEFFPITTDRYLWEGSNNKNSAGWVHSSSTATSGMQVYSSRLFPERYWNKMIFTCEGASKLCNMDSLEVSGSIWKAHHLPGPVRSNLIASTDAWVAPVLAKTGPDGAVWVLDWNNYLFLHNPAQPAGAGGAWNNKLRVKSTNRIYRVLPTNATPEPVLNLTNATEDQLIDALGSQNFFWRLTAQRLLIAKASPTAVTKLVNILSTNKELDAVGNSPRVQHALWALEGMGEFTKSPATYIPILQGLLKHPAWCVRRNALRAMPRTADGAAAINTACSVNDPHAHVRLQALVAFSETSSKPASINPIQSSYATLDATATTAQKASGVPTGTPSCSVTLDASVPFVTSTTTAAHQAAQAPREGLRFHIQAGGFQLMPHGNLPSGELTIYDLKGRAVFASRYDAGSSSWSVASAHGLNQPVYGYAFRGVDGYTQRGSLALLSAR